MDILNFISWIRGRRQVTSVDPAKTLIPVGLKDGRRDDEYLAGAISVEDLAAQIVPPPTPSTNIYNSNGALTANRQLNGNDYFLTFNGVRGFGAYGTSTPGNAKFSCYAQNNFNLLGLFIESGSGTQRRGLRQEEYFSTPEGFNLILGDNTQGHLRFNYNQNISGFSTSSETSAADWTGLKLDFTNKVYQLGQITGSNTTNITINDAATYPVQVSGTNVLNNTAGAASGQFLKIKINGVDYKIALLNP